MSQRERRRMPQWALVGEVRARLRGLSPQALVQTLADVAPEGEEDKDYLPPPRAFLLMLCSEIYKRRDQLSSRERARVGALLLMKQGGGLGAIYQPDARFWQRVGGD